MIRLVQESDIEELAKIYKELYDNADIGENWTKFVSSLGHES